MNEIIEALALVRPYDVDKAKVRIGPWTDGGYVFIDDFSPEQNILSYGIGGEYRFDAEMANRGHNVYMFDHTIDGVNATSDRMRFFREGVAGRSSPTSSLYSIADHLARHNIAGDRLILKMDVEGAEWDALLNTPDQTLARFEQIVIEVHELARLGEVEFQNTFKAFFRKLNRHFTLFHTHANNYDGDSAFGIVGGVPTANLMEYSYIRTSKVTRSQSKTVYPTAYDAPNVGNKDKLLWFYPYLPTSASASDFALCSDRLDLWYALQQKGG